MWSQLFMEERGSASVKGVLFGKQYWEGFWGGKAAMVQCCPVPAAPGSAAVRQEAWLSRSFVLLWNFGFSRCWLSGSCIKKAATFNKVLVAWNFLVWRIHKYFLYVHALYSLYSPLQMLQEASLHQLRHWKLFWWIFPVQNRWLKRACVGE